MAKERVNKFGHYRTSNARKVNEKKYGDKSGTPY